MAGRRLGPIREWHRKSALGKGADPLAQPWTGRAKNCQFRLRSGSDQIGRIQIASFGMGADIAGPMPNHALQVVACAPGDMRT